MGRCYPQRPIPAVGAVVVKDADVLLVMRGKDPGYGEWSIPGGAIRVGETLEQAVIRETKEEVGILIEPVGLVEALDRIIHDKREMILYHYILLDFLCLYRSGRLKAGSDAIEARWVKGPDIGRCGLRRDTEEVIRKGLKMVESRAGKHNDK